MPRMRASASAGLLLAGSWAVQAVQAEPVAPAVPVAGGCLESAGAVSIGTAQWNGWGRDLENSRYQPEPALRAADVAKLRLKWAYGLAGGSESGAPTVVDGRVFVANSAGHIVALDALTGCSYWSFDTAHGIRAALVVGELEAPRRVAGAPKLSLKSKGRRKHKLKEKDKTDAHIEVRKPRSAVFAADMGGTLYALDAATGRLLWRAQPETDPEAHVTGSPVVYKTRLYVPIDAHPASLVALDIVTGDLVWRSVLTSGGADLALDSGATIDAAHDTAFLATGASTAPTPQPTSHAILAIDLAGGNLRWTKQLAPSSPAGSFAGAPILRTLRGDARVLVVTQDDGVLYGLDPAAGGAILWRNKADPDATGAALWGAAADHRSVFTGFAMPAPGGGGLAAFALASGKLRWVAAAPLATCGSEVSPCGPLQSQAITVMPGVAFSGSHDGHLRAYSTIDGKIVWDFDTAEKFATTNGVAAQGGGLDRAGPAVVGGMIYVSSGNALLAFAADRK